MRLPFTHEEFLDVFGAFNVAWWPATLVLWLLTAFAVAALARGRASARPLFLLLAAHWAWSGAAYHLGYFAAINPAARVFGVGFLLQAAIFLWAAVRRDPPTVSWGRTPRHMLSVAFALYALVYPVLALASGLRWPRMPAFGVPCPTTLFTVALLLALEPGRHRTLAIIPLIWAVIGGSAALVLGVPADWALFIGALSLAANAAAPRLFETRVA